MSILSTFYILFKSDTKDLEKGAASAEKTTQKLADKLKSVGKESEKTGASFLHMAQAAGKFLAATATAGLAIAGVKNALDLGVQLSRTSRLLGVNAEDLNAWGNAVTLAGGDAKQFESTLKSLSDKFGSTPAIALKALPKYADLLSRLSPQRAQQVGKGLGLDEGTILLLQQGRREIEDIIKSQKELFTITTKDAEAFGKYDLAIKKSEIAQHGLFNYIASIAVPYLTKFYDILYKTIKTVLEHKDLVIGALYAIGAAALFIGRGFLIASAPIIAMSLLIGGLIALFAIVYDDVQAFLKGQDSVLGYLLEKYPKTADAIKGAFKIMTQAAYAFLHPIDTIIAALNKVKELIENIFHGGNRKLTIGVTNGKDLVRGSGGHILPIIPGSNTSSTNTNKTVNINAKNVNTQATDSQGIANAIGGDLTNQIKQSNAYFDTPVHS